MCVCVSTQSVVFCPKYQSGHTVIPIEECTFWNLYGGDLVDVECHVDVAVEVRGVVHV